MKILGISAFYHDSAAAIVVDGRLIAAAHEERFTRKKHDASFPVHAIRNCLDVAGMKLHDIDALSFYDKPFLKFERLLETHANEIPSGYKQFLKAMPVWMKEKFFMKRILRTELQETDETKFTGKLLFPEHHLSHASSAFYPSPFREAAILTIDGVGEWSTASLCHGENNSIQVLKELHFPHSLGLLYSSFTYFLGFKVNSGEYKLMGLAPYGHRNSELYKRTRDFIENELARLYDDGSLFLDQRYFTYAGGLRMIPEQLWEEKLGLKRRNSTETTERRHAHVALAIQDFTEEVVLRMAKEIKRITGSQNLCMAGGVALNCTANGRLIRERIFDRVFIQPAAGDAGGAAGAAWAAEHIYYERPRVISANDGMHGSALGTAFSDDEILSALKDLRAVYSYLGKAEDICRITAQHLSEGKIIGWFQGRAEYGPRALGHRSILASPLLKDMQGHLNAQIKFRERFRPFAPAVTAEAASSYFELDEPSPYMLLTCKVKNVRNVSSQLADDNLLLQELLQRVESILPAVTHADGSARVQTVDRAVNPLFYSLLSAFGDRTGHPVLVNTSFNVKNEPIVQTPAEAYACFMRSGVDTLVIGNYLLKKEEQPVWTDDGKSSRWEED